MKNVIRYALIGLVSSLLLLATFGGLFGYFHGLALDGPTAAYGFDGAVQTIALILLIWGIRTAAIGLVSGAIVGAFMRRSSAS